MASDPKKQSRRGVFGRPAPDCEAGILWDHNRTESPLLRLPPEIRNRIYEYVLDVGQIHIHYSVTMPASLHRPRPRPRPRPGSGPDASSTPSSLHAQQYADDAMLILQRRPRHEIYARGEYPWQAMYIATAAASNIQGGGRNVASSQGKLQTQWQRQQVKARVVTLMSRVCRQLYEETALLPFQLNVWSFERASDLERYVVAERRMPKPHRQALREIALAPDWHLSKKVANMLRGLQAVHVWKRRDRKPVVWRKDVEGGVRKSDWCYD